jgi:stage II sporulation protein D
MVARLIGVLTVIAWMVACASAITPLKPHITATPVSTSPAVAEPAVASAPVPVTHMKSRTNTASGHDQTDLAVRVALVMEQQSIRLSASGAWSLYDRTGEHPLSRADVGDTWTIEVCGAMVCGTNNRGDRMPSISGPLVARPLDENSVLSYNGKPYRGEIMVLSTDTGLVVINRLSVESYLRGVVPMEIGVDRTATEEAAVQAQAIAARSFVYTRLDDNRTYDVTATVMDQVYGGVDAERPVSDAAVEATRDMVLMYNGKVVSAPYHSNSGGMTAAASEVWRTRDQPYLIAVSDRIPGTDHYYDEQSPKFRWTRSYDEGTLETVLDKYLRKYADVPRSGVGKVHSVVETGRTQSGRVAGLLFVTDRGRFTVRGNEVRFVLRTLDGDVLPSTLFTLDVSNGDDGMLQQVTLHGTGNGHGVGMDQWGAIARARAGQDCLTILHTYYPGTTVGRMI